MRIIAGSAKRTHLVAPKGLDTRPTADMAKESLFNIIAADISGTRFLDLYCGSGAIGLEALSRGAKEAVFVDSGKPAVAATTQNLEKTRLTQRGQVLDMPVAKAISMLDSSGQVFDIIFLDPPYDTGLLPQTLTQLAATNLLHPASIIIAETDAKIYEANPFATPSALELTDTRLYGRTCFLFYRRVLV
ncbi:MAG: 16S rRNA (guanine(966)-N(2))-methyltransferase RsmD [Defluviitaleaceae bacterium]|nr:16S rRNA (guanine(966)-N(2))-methyltransferase RsmD [Defluviitaleaceae bacterium]